MPKIHCSNFCRANAHILGAPVAGCLSSRFRMQVSLNMCCTLLQLLLGELYLVVGPISGGLYRLHGSRLSALSFLILLWF